MGYRYKDLENEGLEDTVREITEDEMRYGLPSGYDAVERYAAYDPDDVAYRGDYGIGDNAFLNDSDWNTLQGYKDQWQKAYEAGDQAGMDAAHAAAQKIRYKYGYSGGADGSEYNTIVANMSSLKNRDSGFGSYGGYGGYGSGSGWPTYSNKYQERIDALTDAILGRDPFSYDKDTDPLYQQYKDSYTRGAQRSMQDTLAQLSARTGGLASSYAGSASQQAYNNYMAQLADKVPELYQLAYSMYQDDLDNQRTDLNMLMGLESSDYSKYLDQLSQYNTDREFNYGVSRDQVADSQWQQQFDYNVSRDAVEDARYDQEWAYQLMQDAAKQASSGSSGGSSGGTSGTSSGISDVYQWLADNGATDYGTAYQMLRNAGYTATDANRYAKYFSDNAGNYINSGLQTDHFRASMQSIAQQLAANKQDAAEENVNRIWDQLNSEQKQQLMDLLDRYGMTAE